MTDHSSEGRWQMRQDARPLSWGCQVPVSSHLKCNPSQRRFWEGSLGAQGEMGVFPGHLWGVSASRSPGETVNAERILLNHGVPPIVCDSNFDWQATLSAGSAARSELWARTAIHPDQRIGRGRISLVGAVESAVAAVHPVHP